MARSAPDLPGPDPGRVASVSEFTRRVKELLEGGLPPTWVRGEVSNLRVQASGHVYFTLKDAAAQLACVLFRGDAARQSVVLRDGQQILAYGQVGVYEARGQYQLVVRALVEHGIGRLQQEFEQLKQRLAAEGLFDSARKVPVPAMPRTVGFITSPTGAAVQDFIRILRRRAWRGRLVVLPARVQGEGAATELAEMLRLADALHLDERGQVLTIIDDLKSYSLTPFFDLLVIGRGGGSLEDLWPFNEEPLVRAVGACRVPVISAVGHEIDYTLCDFAADVRAETPSAAAELISSQFIACVDRTGHAAEQLEGRMAAALEQAGERLDHARSRLRLLTPIAAIEQRQLRLDDLSNRLATAVAAAVQADRHRLTVAATRLAARSPEQRVQHDSHRLLALWKRLEAASPVSVLKRGFVIVRDAQGRPVARRAAVIPGQRLVNEFHDGPLPVRAE
jgi:exodeoxyribonuclease VII large subunit